MVEYDDTQFVPVVALNSDAGQSVLVFFHASATAVPNTEPTRNWPRRCNQWLAPGKLASVVEQLWSTIGNHSIQS
jgi:hypothetical protein